MQVKIFLFSCLFALFVNVNGFYGSEDAEKHSAPFMVNFHYNSSVTEVHCGGVILTRNIVLTSTSCLKFVFENVTVTAGDYNVQITEITEQKRTIKKVLTHPNLRGYAYNFKLVFLNTDLDFNDYVKPIALPEIDECFTGDVIGYGWGKVNKTDYPDVLQRVKTTLIKRDVCKKNIDDREVQLTPFVHFCTWRDNNKVNMLEGDEGGPIIQFKSGIPYLVGVMATAGSPKDPGLEPMVHGNVAAVREFFDEYIN